MIAGTARLHATKTNPSKDRKDSRIAHNVHNSSSRRSAIVSLSGSFLFMPLTSQAALADLPSPEVGDCVDCIGVLNGLLNSCPPETTSCVSSQNDDEQRFIKPWVYEEDRKAAMDKLVYVATGGDYDPGFVGSPFGLSRMQAASFILRTTAAFMTGDALPDRPTRAKMGAGQRRVFEGRLQERDDAQGYLRFTFGDGDQVDYDAEFIFLPDDELVDIRVSARGDRTQDKVELTIESGFKLLRNGSRQLCEDLRKALRWESAVVITSFDPRFNNDKKFWFEKSFEAMQLAPRNKASGGNVPKLGDDYYDSQSYYQ